MTLLVAVIARDLADISVVGAIFLFSFLDVLGFGCYRNDVGSCVVLTRGGANFFLFSPFSTCLFVFYPSFSGGL